MKNKQKLTHEEVINRLPPNIKMIDEYTHSQKRYRFLDIEYNQEFMGTIYDVIDKCKRCSLFYKKKYNRDPEIYKVYDKPMLCKYVRENNIEHLKELGEKNPSAYYYAKKLDIVLELFPLHKTPRAKYTIDELAEVAKKYINVTRFRLEQPSVYHAIKRRKLTKELMGHMRSRRVSIGEDILAHMLALIMDIKPERNVRGVIDSRLEIDIYFSALKLAFEYDGARYHTEEKNALKDGMCLNCGINLYRITEPLKCNSLRQIIDNIKTQLHSVLLDINKKYHMICDITKIADVNENNISHVISNSFTIDEIQNIVSEYSSLKQFRKKEHELYSLILELRRGDLLAGLTRERSSNHECTKLNKDEMMDHIKNKFSTYNEFNGTKEYTKCARESWLDDAKKVLPTISRTELFWGELIKMTEDEMLIYFRNTYENYSDLISSDTMSHFIKKYVSVEFKNKLKKELGLAKPARKDWNEWAYMTDDDAIEYIKTMNISTYKELCRNKALLSFITKRKLQVEVRKLFPDGATYCAKRIK